MSAQLIQDNDLKNRFANELEASKQTIQRLNDLIGQLSKTSFSSPSGTATAQPLYHEEEYEKEENGEERFDTEGLEMGEAETMPGVQEISPTQKFAQVPVYQPPQALVYPPTQPRQFTVTGRPISKNRPTPISIQRRNELLKNPPTTLRQTLENYTCGELAFSNWVTKRLVIIGEERLLERALSRISTHNVHSFPVISRDQKFIGLIDILDIIHAFIDATKNESRAVQFNVRRDFMNRTVSSLFGPNKPKTWGISNTSSLFSAARHMVRTKQERFLILDKKIDGDVAMLTEPEVCRVDGILTQADILRFLSQNIMMMRNNPIFQKSLKELGLGNRVPKTVSNNENILNAFKSLGNENCVGAAVVDQYGKLVANLSASDLKGVTRRNAPILQTTVEQYLSRDQKRGWWTRPIVADLNDSLFHTIFQFVSLKVHRMYVVDSQHKPIGEINQLDLLEQLLRINNM